MLFRLVGRDPQNLLLSSACTLHVLTTLVAMLYGIAEPFFPSVSMFTCHHPTKAWMPMVTLPEDKYPRPLEDEWCVVPQLRCTADLFIIRNTDRFNVLMTGATHESCNSRVWLYGVQ